MLEESELALCTTQYPLLRVDHSSSSASLCSQSSCIQCIRLWASEFIPLRGLPRKIYRYRMIEYSFIANELPFKRGASESSMRAVMECQ